VDQDDVIVIGLPRGGIVVAAEVARLLNRPLDLVVPRKIGCPTNPEFAVGALTEDGHIMLNEHDLSMLGLSEIDLHETIQHEKVEAQRRLAAYRAGRPPRQFEGKTLILVDDGIATGSTMKVSIQAAKARNASRVVVAVPVMPHDRVKTFEKLCDELVTVSAPASFRAVGQFYSEFSQTEDSQVIRLMKDSAAATASHPHEEHLTKMGEGGEIPSAATTTTTTYTYE
jgi:predicted phosphoribosyltransferase